jgi:hypothetical protein
MSQYQLNVNGVIDLYTYTPPLPEYKIISLGYRCSVAGILKKLGLKHESFPFDWLISRLSVIRHCIEDDFQEFLRVENYQRKHTLTFPHIDATDNCICEEDLWANMYYQPAHIPNPIHTYQYHFAMNHHNIVEKNADFEYFKRCVQRLRTELNSKTSKMFVHITPLYTIESYQKSACNIVNECCKFQTFLETIGQQQCQDGIEFEDGECDERGIAPYTVRSLYFVMVLDNLESTPTLTILHEHINDPIYKHKIYVLKTNCEFIDTGETFMGNYRAEEELIGNSIRRFST